MRVFLDRSFFSRANGAVPSPPHRAALKTRARQTSLQENLSNGLLQSDLRVKVEEPFLLCVSITLLISNYFVTK